MLTDTTIQDLMPADTPHYMFGAWVSCIYWALGQAECLDRFRADTGTNWKPGRTPIDRMIDEQTGVAEHVLIEFIKWFNVNVWGQSTAMMYLDALAAVIDDGIEAARLDYGKPHDKLKLDGAILGFEECRDKSPVEIARLLEQARDRTQIARSEYHEDGKNDYWYWRCRELEIEWVANVVSALLMQKGLPIIVPVTARGLLKAVDIVGVKPIGSHSP